MKENNNQNENKFFERFEKKPKANPKKREEKTEKTENKERKPFQGKKPDFRKKPNGKPDSNSKSGKMILSELFDEKLISPESAEILSNFDDVVADVCNLSGKQRIQLAGKIKKLSHELTDDRNSRRLGYMNDASLVSAYISYFMWWNLVRLVRLFSNLPKECFKLDDNSIAIDVGSGPLTIPVALWLARPELRGKKITWYCMDLSQTALSQGENLYLSIAAKTKCEPWKIVRVKGPLGTQIKEKADFITCGNVFNEIVQHNEMPTDFLAKKYSGDLEKYLKQDSENPTTVFLVEPGDPHSARFVSLMRDAFIRRGFMPLSPCPHIHACPMEGRKSGSMSGKWCNFGFDTESAPSKLLKLSEKAGLPKERAVLSFVLSQKTKETKIEKVEDSSSIMDLIKQNKSRKLKLRVASDFIKLPQIHRSGYYCCSELGLVLAIDEHGIHPKNGSVLEIPFPTGQLETDEKSGALEIKV